MKWCADGKVLSNNVGAHNVIYNLLARGIPIGALPETGEHPHSLDPLNVFPHLAGKLARGPNCSVLNRQYSITG